MGLFIDNKASKRSLVKINLTPQEVNLLRKYPLKYQQSATSEQPSEINQLQPSTIQERVSPEINTRSCHVFYSANISTFCWEIIAKQNDNWTNLNFLKWIALFLKLGETVWVSQKYFPQIFSGIAPKFGCVTCLSQPRVVIDGSWGGDIEARASQVRRFEWWTRTNHFRT